MCCVNKVCFTLLRALLQLSILLHRESNFSNTGLEKVHLCTYTHIQNTAHVHRPHTRNTLLKVLLCSIRFHPAADTSLLCNSQTKASPFGWSTTAGLIVRQPDKAECEREEQVGVCEVVFSLAVCFVSALTRARMNNWNSAEVIRKKVEGQEGGERDVKVRAAGEA